MATAPPTHPLTKLTPESTSEKVAGNTSDKQLIGLMHSPDVEATGEWVCRIFLAHSNDTN